MTRARKRGKSPVSSASASSNRPAVVRIVVKGAQHSPVAACLAQRRKCGAEVLFGHIPQETLAEIGGDSSHLTGDIGIIVGQIAMAGSCIDNAERMAGGGEIIICAADHGRSRVLKVDGDSAADRSTHLIHQGRRACRNRRFPHTVRSWQSQPDPAPRRSTAG